MYMSKFWNDYKIDMHLTKNDNVNFAFFIINVEMMNI